MKSSKRNTYIREDEAADDQSYTPYHRLANAIVAMAAFDLRQALRALDRGSDMFNNGSRRDVSARALRDECMSFFLSTWCSEISPIEGQLILSKIMAEDRSKPFRQYGVY